MSFRRAKRSEAPVVPGGYTRRRGPQKRLVVGGASVWNERMLAALKNGVKGGKWFSLIDKVYRAETLKVAWQKVAGTAEQQESTVKASSSLRPERRCISRN